MSDEKNFLKKLGIVGASNCLLIGRKQIALLYVLHV